MFLEQISKEKNKRDKEETCKLRLKNQALKQKHAKLQNSVSSLAHLGYKTVRKNKEANIIKSR